jgi:hypothetical protein
VPIEIEGGMDAIDSPVRPPGSAPPSRVRDELRRPGADSGSHTAPDEAPELWIAATALVAALLVAVALCFVFYPTM